MNTRTILKIIATVALAVGLVSCGSGGGGTYIPPSGDSGNSGGGSTPLTGAFVVLAWNDLGMHCLNPSYDTAVILPPYNTVWAQVIQRGNKPVVVTSGITVEYRIINNTTSQKGLFVQFWQNAQKLFGVTPAIDKGLNLDDPTVSNGLSGTMLTKGDHFQVSGIPVVPYNDGSTIRNAYQVAEITVKNSAGTVLATTQCTVPTSDEINCAKCHAPGQSITATFNDILQKHDSARGTTLMSSKPVLCASCHGSPALGQTGPGTSGKYLSFAIHDFHANKTAPGGAPIACYDCHPGASTSCNRSAKHTALNGNCTTCHGDMANVANTITAVVNPRIPWVNEPKCMSTACHAAGNNGGIIPEVDTLTTLYRNAKGHGGLYCAGCHGSPHAMVPSTQSTDNYQALQYQQKEKSLGSCLTSACHEHSTSRGGNSSGSNFVSQHGNGSSKCGICHTGFIQGTDATKWPHGYNWKARP
jgi:hypothetical protein